MATPTICLASAISTAMTESFEAALKTYPELEPHRDLFLQLVMTESKVAEASRNLRDLAAKSDQLSEQLQTSLI